MTTAEIGVQEKRRVQRTRVLRGVMLIFSQRAQTVNCVVRNLTNLGACLHVASTTGIPATFELTFDDGRSRRACRVTWRRADRLGVAFE
jgi:methyl-accepting chemotaxis protein